MSKSALPPPTSVYFNFVLPERYRDRTARDVYAMLETDRALFLWLVAQEIAREFTSKPATDAFLHHAHDASTVDAALAARNIVLKKG